jgi:UDP-N-acetylmuramoyl-L-alanyl-D-glutamate--2,6-diaminopimelate ligase
VNAPDGSDRPGPDAARVSTGPGPGPVLPPTLPPEFVARFAAAHPRLRTVAVTGTNGKTTTTTMVEAIVAAAGEPAARLTTLGAWVAGAQVPCPDPVREFLGTVERAVELGVRTLALETTSKALAAGLGRRWPPTVAVFTNLTRDHLDMHGSVEAYLAAKAQLFMALPADGVAVLNADDPASSLLAEVIPTGVTRRWYAVLGVTGGAPDLAAASVTCAVGRTHLLLRPSPLADALGGELVLGVTGAVHAQNALAAALATAALGYPPAAIRAGLAAFRGVRGRFEVVATRPLVVVDYAHTPDGLLGTLTTARAITPAGGRLLCVFGCGGLRDRGKRPQMGKIADDLADLVVLTTDNPRHEAPAAIAAEIQAGASPTRERARWHVELDRAAAIAWAVAEAGADDVVIIAGKGHETVQEVAGRELPFDDAAVARAALAAQQPSNT